MAPRNLLVPWLALLMCLVSTVSAIHEDEQGLRDWIMHLVGDVHTATVERLQDASLIYVASSDGAVAGISTDREGGINLTWRVMSTEKPLCVASSSVSVLSVGEQGTVTLLTPDTGAVQVTFLLQMESNRFSRASCAISGDEASIVGYDGEKLSLYSFSLKDEEEQIALKSSTVVGGDVTALKMAGNRLLVGRSNGKVDVMQVATLHPESSVDGIVGLVNSDGVFTVRRARTGGVTIYQQIDATETIECETCTAARIEDAETGASEPAKVVVTDLDNGVVAVKIGDAEPLALAVMNSPVGNVEILLAFAAREDQYALIKLGTGDLVLVSEKNGMIWHRYESLAHTPATMIIDPTDGLDHFHFNKQVLMATRCGNLLSIPLHFMGQVVELVATVGPTLLKESGAAAIEEVRIQRLLADRAPQSVVLEARYKTKTIFATVSLTESKVTAVTSVEDALLATPHLRMSKDLFVEGSAAQGETPLFTYVSDVEAGSISGYTITSTSEKARPTWSLKMPHPIVAHATGADVLRTTVVDSMRIYPNKTGREPVDEVRHMYPMRNVIAVAYYEPSEKELPTLVVAAIDSVTGSILGTASHANVEGPIKMVIVDNAIIYYFLDAERMRYSFGVWELFEEESGPIMHKTAGATIPHIIASFFINSARTFSSRASRPPVVVVSTLGSFAGPLADMSVTTSNNAIARKSLVLAYESGRVAVVEVLRLLSGGQMPLPGSADKQMSHVIIPSMLLATHRHRIAMPQQITTAPTGLESSCHVVISGLDVFYVRSSSGKPFDLLNSDFNKPLLVMLVCGFAALSVVIRYLVTRKALNAAWK